MLVIVAEPFPFPVATDDVAAAEEMCTFMLDMLRGPLPVPF